MVDLMKGDNKTDVSIKHCCMIILTSCILYIKKQDSSSKLQNLYFLFIHFGVLHNWSVLRFSDISPIKLKIT